MPLPGPTCGEPGDPARAGWRPNGQRQTPPKPHRRLVCYQPTCRAQGSSRGPTLALMLPPSITRATRGRSVFPTRLPSMIPSVQTVSLWQVCARPTWRHRPSNSCPGAVERAAGPNGVGGVPPERANSARFESLVLRWCPRRHLLLYPWPLCSRQASDMPCLRRYFTVEQKSGGENGRNREEELRGT
jgi:hypothetical protein